MRGPAVTLTNIGKGFTYMTNQLSIVPNGSEDGSMVAVAAMPGYKMQDGVDASTEEGFRAWVDSVHPAFAAAHLADRLILDGFDRVTSAHLFSEARLRSEFDVKTGHALQFVSAAEAMRLVLGLAREVAALTATDGRYNKRTPAPKVPVASPSSQGCGVACLATVAAVRAWMLQLISWARS